MHAARDLHPLTMVRGPFSVFVVYVDFSCKKHLLQRDGNISQLGKTPIAVEIFVDSWMTSFEKNRLFVWSGVSNISLSLIGTICCR